ncbi:NAD(P)H-dependent oxidoreductase [Streptomyces sp. NA02950]|uniref:NADPH-dependent FMN reductase n=1 Tax=Streptomyces sp. NA02950 TaxID=2742137 RepID=UPI00158FBC20|nr:NAD(P)H-dependent oxidoreductase [Streptomyces sp. NA02950]QKV97002.1 NAD(P)H-dependent oxidoreductase [Streptomyces sp. NA02950]
MSGNPHRLAVVIGSVRQGRIGPGVASWFAQEARKHGHFAIDVIDLAEARLPELLTDEPPTEVRALAPRLAAADAFVLVTPEYNRSFPASLKTAIDWYVEEWQAKPVGLVSYGGIGAGIRSSEALRPVLTELHAVVVRDAINIRNVWEDMDDSGTLRAPAELDAAAKVLLDQLAWWGTALHDAKAKQPFKAGPA